MFNTAKNANFDLILKSNFKPTYNGLSVNIKHL